MTIAGKKTTANSPRSGRARAPAPPPPPPTRRTPCAHASPLAAPPA